MEDTVVDTNEDNNAINDTSEDIDQINNDENEAEEDAEDEPAIDYGPTDGDEYNLVCNQDLKDNVYKMKESVVLCLFFDDKKNPP